MARAEYVAELPSRHTEVRSVWDQDARHEAALLAKQGEAFSSYNRGVCAVWVDGGNPHAPQTIADIKGERRLNQPLAACLRTDTFVSMLDATKISPDLHDTFLRAGELAARTSSLCFIRAPITEVAVQILPPAMVSRQNDGTPILQNWDPEGHEPTLRLLEEMYDAGIQFPAVTSLNPSGTPEIVSQTEGYRFSNKAGIPLFLEDPHDPGIVKGSFTIVHVDQEGLKLVRDGNIPAHMLEKLLDKPIQETANTRRTVHKQPDFPETIFEHVSHPAEGRQAILTFITAGNQKNQ
jgi:hypothetical protein